MAKRKTPAYAVKAIEQHTAAVDRLHSLIRMKATVPSENLAEHIRDGDPAIWIARVEGQALMLESLLFNAGCYAGFTFGSEADWDRTYIIRH